MVGSVPSPPAMLRSPMCTIRRTPPSVAACFASCTISTPMRGTPGPTARIFTPCMSGLLALDDVHGLFEVYVFAAGGVRLVVEAHTGDVEHAEDVGPGAGHDVAGEATECVAARAAGVQHGRNAGADAGEVWVDAVLVDAFVHVGVQVDHAGYDDVAGDIDDARRARGVYVGGDFRYEAVCDGDVQLRPDVLRRVDYFAALQ